MRGYLYLAEEKGQIIYCNYVILYFIFFQKIQNALKVLQFSKTDYKTREHLLSETNGEKKQLVR